MGNRNPLIAGNWKMNKTGPESVTAAKIIAGLASDSPAEIEIMIAPPFTALALVAEVIASSRIFLSAQNLFWEEKGAYTGEISSDMLLAAGCSHVIIGHSERRLYFGETDNTINKKIKTAINAKLIPVFCIGESEEERESGKTFSVLDKQVQKGLEGFSSTELATLIIAYEPVWAIGTGKTASKDQAQEVHQYLRNLINKLFGNTLANSIRILYGGSVKPDNIKELMAMPDIDGALVGGASLDPEIFGKLFNYSK